MELLQLEYFCDAAKQENFSKTAKKYNVPTSNISQTVHRLEVELGTKLFDRYANRIMLNEKGRIFYENISLAIEKIEDAKSALDDNLPELHGVISIQICTNRRIVSMAIKRFRELYPNVVFKIIHDVDSEENFDLIISDGAPNQAYDEKQLLLKENIYLAISRHNKLCEKSKISFEDIKAEKFIAMHNKSSHYRITKKLCNLNGFEPDIIIQSDDPFYVRQYVEMELGIAFIPMISWKGQFSDNIVLKNIGDITRDTYIFTSAKKYKTKSIRLFIEMLLNICKKSSI